LPSDELLKSAVLPGGVPAAGDAAIPDGFPELSTTKLKI
jgi:hypothetical protein